MALPDPDVDTHERLVAEAHLDDRLGARIFSAVCAYMLAHLGPDETAKILREWADEIQANEPDRSNTSKAN